MTTHLKNFEPQTTCWDPFQDLNNMHNKFLFHKKNMNKKQLKARLDFLQEELDEAYLALDDNNADDFVDAHVDLIVVAIGTLDLARVNAWLAWDEVHSANMAKELGMNSKRPDMGMDLRKPEGWKKPSHAGNVGKLVDIMLADETYQADKPRTELRRRALEVLENAKQTMLKKAQDYNAPGSRVKTADYYPRGLDDLWHMLHIKMLRITSICDVMRNGGQATFEPLTDSLEDLIVFAAMMVEFAEGKMDGQHKTTDLFGRPKE